MTFSTIFRKSIIALILCSSFSIHSSVNLFQALSSEQYREASLQEFALNETLEKNELYTNKVFTSNCLAPIKNSLACQAIKTQSASEFLLRENAISFEATYLISCSCLTDFESGKIVRQEIFKKNVSCYQKIVGEKRKSEQRQCQQD